MTKNKTDLSCSERKPMKGLGKTRPFLGLLIFDVINRLIFGHGVVIYYLFLVASIYWQVLSMMGNFMAIDYCEYLFVS